MAHDSYIKSFQSLDDYGTQLLRDAQDLENTYTNIKDEVARISSLWEDEQQLWLMERIEADKQAIEELVDMINRFGRAIITYAENTSNSARRFCQ